MELVVGARLASLEGLAAVEKRSGWSWLGLSELKRYNLGSLKALSVYTGLSGRTDNRNPGYQEPVFDSTCLISIFGREEGIKMNYRKYLGAAAILIAVTVAGAVVFQKPLMAQVRAALVRDVDNPSLAPFRGGAGFVTDTFDKEVFLTKVPAGKRLVIEHISYACAGHPRNQLMAGGLTAGQFGALHVFLEIHPPREAIPGLTYQDGSQPVRVYFEPGEEVWVQLTNNPDDSRRFEIRVEGYYVNLTP
jgi:hypothetical protein